MDRDSKSKVKIPPVPKLNFPTSWARSRCFCKDPTGGWKCICSSVHLLSRFIGFATHTTISVPDSITAKEWELLPLKAVKTVSHTHGFYYIANLHNWNNTFTATIPVVLSPIGDSQVIVLSDVDASIMTKRKKIKLSKSTNLHLLNKYIFSCYGEC